MNFIVFDLEATCWENRLKRQSEIIEIGAMKLNEYAEVVDTFSSFIKPVVHPFLSPFCIQLTSITQVQVNRAAKFYTVITEFQDWISMEEEYLLCSWGDYDRKQLIKDCEFHEIDSFWVDEHINLKAQYQKIRGLNKPIGLKKAVTVEGFEFDGVHHRGIDDAYNLAKIFGKFFDEWVY